MNMTRWFRSSLTALLTLAAVSGATGCAVEAGDDKFEAEAVGQTQEALRTRRSQYRPSQNCWWTPYTGESPFNRPDTLHCEPRDTGSGEKLFNNGSYLLLGDLDAQKDMRLHVTNRGSFPVTVYVAQGFNVTAGHVRLQPGESTILQRIDKWTLAYSALVKIEEPGCFAWACGGRGWRLDVTPFYPDATGYINQHSVNGNVPYAQPGT
jgi:hypothetical protein